MERGFRSSPVGSEPITEASTMAADVFRSSLYSAIAAPVTGVLELMDSRAEARAKRCFASIGIEEPIRASSGSANYYAQNVGLAIGIILPSFLLKGRLDRMLEPDREAATLLPAKTGPIPSVNEIMLSTSTEGLTALKAQLNDQLVQLNREHQQLKANYTQVQELINKFIKTPLRAGQTAVDKARDQAALEAQLGERQAYEQVMGKNKEINLAQSLLSLADRSLLRKGGSLPAIPSLNLALDARVDLRGINRREVAGRISALLEESGLSPDQVDIRFFDAGREDLVRTFGTDRFGVNSESTDRRSFGEWDNYHLPALRSKGLTAEDGLFVGDFDFASSAYANDLSEGGRSLALYDKSQIIPLEGDFGYFKYPDQKQKALVGIVANKFNMLQK